MQRDITSFFKRVAPPVKASVNEEDPLPAAKKKRRAIVISSDEDEEVPSSPAAAKKAPENKKKCLDAKSPKPNESKSGIKKPSLSKLKQSPKKSLKPIDPTALFGGEMLRVEAKRVPPPKPKEVVELEDTEIDTSLMEIDLIEIEQKQTEKEHSCSKSKTPRKSPQEEQDSTDNNRSKTPRNGSAQKQNNIEERRPKSKTPSKNLQHELNNEEERNFNSRTPQKVSPQKQNDIEECSSKSKTPHKNLQQELNNVEEGNSNAKSSRNDSHKEKAIAKGDSKNKLNTSETKINTENAHAEKTQSAKKHTPKTPKETKPSKVKKEHKEDLESSVLSDEDRHERKRMAAILYQKYKNRSSVINPGSKEVPKGTPNCLAGFTFLVTGILESLERDEANSIIKEYGGKVVTTVGKRLNYLVVGEEAGPKKLAQAEEFGINVISEDGLFDLIRKKSGATSNGVNKVKEETPSTSSVAKKRNHEDDVKIKTEKKTPLKKPKEDISLKAEASSDKVIKQELLEQPSNGLPTEQPTVDDDLLAWVDKYKPKSVNDIVGQYGPSSNAAKLENWLKKWYANHDGKKKLQRPNPWAKNDDGSFYKAALLSGPPGIGKTTTANLVCKELGFDTVEFNASDTRNKRLLKEEVAELLTNKSLYGYFHGMGGGVTKKHVLIMDEVDGMSGNQDRGGMQELIALIKDSSVPVICICNDRNHQRMRSLVNYCYDLRFNKPRLQQIKGRILSICCKENFKIDPSKVEEIIAATNNDIRQTINHISLLSAGKDFHTANDKNISKIAEKDLKLGPWEVVRKVFAADEHKNMSLNDKCDLFFHDYSLGPLFVQQNYLQVAPTGSKSEIIRKVALTADALSLGDLVDKRIRSASAWSLLPTQAVFSSVMPGEYMCGHFTGQINFPGWLGKNSRANKRNRLAQEIHDHTRLRTSGSRQSIRLDYAPFLLQSIVQPMKEHGAEGVSAALNVVKEYHLLREDIDSLIELTAWPGKKSVMDAVDGRVKAALTRAYNKEVLAYSYSAAANIKKKKAEQNEQNELLEIEGEEETIAPQTDDEEEDKLENDGLIKAKKHSSSTSTTKASTSKTKANSNTAKKTASKSTASKAKKV